MGRLCSLLRSLQTIRDGSLGEVQECHFTHTGIEYPHICASWLWKQVSVFVLEVGHIAVLVGSGSREDIARDFLCPRMGRNWGGLISRRAYPGDVRHGDVSA